MKQRDDSVTREKNWAEKMMDFLLGSALPPIYLAGSAAGFGGANERQSKPKVHHHVEEPSGQMGLASFGMSSYCASDTSHRSQGGRS